MGVDDGEASANVAAYHQSTAQAAIPDSETATIKAPRRKPKKKAPSEDIFKDFGKEHDSRAMHEVDLGNGIIVQRCNYKKFWQNDKDLNRWQQGMADTVRHNSLLLRERGRWNEDFRADQADLVQNHNGLFRGRTERW